MRELIIRHGSLAAMTVLGLGLIGSAAFGVPPWGGDQPLVVRFLVILFGLLLPGYELLLPRLRQRWPLAFPDRPRRWSRSALWGVFFVGAGLLALPDWLVAAVTLTLTGLVYLVEAWVLRSAGAAR